MPPSNLPPPGPASPPGWNMAWLGLLLALAGSFHVGCTQASRERLLTPAPVYPSVIRPLDGSLGSVILVQERLKFVVLDYTLSSPPAPGSFLELLRGTNRVGRLRLTRWTATTTAAADIVEGSPQVGDLARPE